MDDSYDREYLLDADERRTQTSDIPDHPHLTSQQAQQKLALNYPPRLTSTIASRESAFEADSDTVSEIDPTARNVLAREDGLPELRMNGLLETGKQRGSVTMNENDGSSYNMFGDDTEEPLLGQDRSKRGASSREDSDEYRHLLDSGTGMMAGVANMANSILGAGIIGLPYALRNAGFVTGTLMVIVLGIVTDWSIRLIALNSKLTGQRSYIGILEQCFGFPGKAAVSFFQFIFAFGGMCAFGVIVG